MHSDDSSPDILNIFLDEAEDMLADWEESCLRLENEVTRDNLDALFRAAHNLKGSSRSVGLEAFGQVVHQLEEVIERCRSASLTVDSTLISSLLDGQSLLLGWVNALKSDRSYQPETSALLEQLQIFMAHNASEVDIQNAFMPETASFGFFPTSDASPEGSSKPEEDIPSKQSIAKNTPSRPTTKAESIRIATDKLDLLLRTIGELSIQNEIISHGRQKGQVGTKLFDGALNLINKGLRELQDVALSLRMQSIDQLLSRLVRVARDVAHQQDKLIDINIEGHDVELDKSVLEKVKDPLVHIIRNAIDHGLEQAEERQRTGKSDTGRLSIQAQAVPEGILIRISDDGRGLSRSKIFDTAVRKGLIDSGDSLSDLEIINLIFAPGFSTAKQITDISGRGVGMDVVKRAIENLGGSITIQSTEGKGSSFEISLPSTLSILDALVVQISGTTYALPIRDLDEVLNLNKFKLSHTDAKARAITLRGHVVPIISLERYLPPRVQHHTHHNHDRYAIVSNFENRKVAFEIDTVVNQQSIVVRPLEGPLGQNPGISGGTILSSGEPGMILNLPFFTRKFAEKYAKEQKHAG